MHREKYLHVAYVFSKCIKVKNNNKHKFYLVLIIKKDVKHNIRNNKSTTDKQSITDTVMIAAFENVYHINVSSLLSAPVKTTFNRQSEVKQEIDDQSSNS